VRRCAGVLVGGCMCTSASTSPPVPGALASQRHAQSRWQRRLLGVGGFGVLVPRQGVLHNVCLGCPSSNTKGARGRPHVQAWAALQLRVQDHLRQVAALALACLCWVPAIAA
jgi:hypothetical protein